MEINIILTDYEVANLIQGMKMLPRNGEWYGAIICKIQTAIENTGLTAEEFKVKHNAGMTPKSVRKHLEIMEHKEKYNI